MIHNFEVERYCLAGLVRFPMVFAEVEPFIVESDFVSRLNRTIYGVIRNILIQGGTLNILLVAEKVKNLGILFDELEVDILDYLEQLTMIQVTEFAAVSFFQELKKVTVRREISKTAENIQRSMASMSDASIEDIVSMADKLYSEKIGLFQRNGKDYSNIYDSMEQTFEELGNNPITEFGCMGPFPKVNELYGSLLRPGNITLIGSRSGIGKSSISFFYLTKVAERYNIPILHLDMGEMSEREIQIRAICMHTGGKVPFHYVETGLFRKNAEMTRLVREAWKKVKPLKNFYKNIGNCTQDEALSFIRRFYLSEVGRGNQFLINYDYLKPFDSDNVNTPEHQSMGHFVGKIKTLITTDVPAPFWTALQLNRTGITSGKMANQVDDSENSFSISDRIYQQTSHSFLFRRKLAEEIATEGARFGNSKLINVKYRHLGVNTHDATNLVRLKDGKLKQNFLHIEAKNFVFEELGDLASTVNQLGQAETVPPPAEDDLVLV